MAWNAWLGRTWLRSVPPGPCRLLAWRTRPGSIRPNFPASAQRLLALATVLARQAVLALDEPTVALDGAGLAMLDAAVRSAAEAGAAVVLVTHELGYARAAAHRILSLDGGRLRSGLTAGPPTRGRGRFGGHARVPGTSCR